MAPFKDEFVVEVVFVTLFGYFLVHGPTWAFDDSNCSCLLLNACDQ